MSQLLYTIATLVAACALTLAAPLAANETSHINTALASRKRGFFGGTTSFFTRADCTNPCVENGFCLGGTTNKGDLDPNNSYGVWHSSEGISGCWDVPAGAKSLLLTETTGHGFSGSSFTCAEKKKAADTKIWDGAMSFDVKFGKGTTGNWQCTYLEGGWKSVGYNW